MSEILRLLQVEDSQSDAELVLKALESAGFDVRAQLVDDAGGMRAALAAGPWDAIIAGYSLPHLDAPGALAVLRETGLDLPFIVVSGSIGEQLAVALMRAGAHDYLMKDDLVRLGPAVRREIQDARIRRERCQTQESLRAALVTAEQRQRMLDAIFTAQTDGVLVFDANRSLIRANPAAQSIIGADPTGMTLDEIATKLFPGQPVELFATHLALQGDTVFGVEHTLRGVVGEISSAPMRDENGTVTGAVTMVRDVTARRYAEMRLREAKRRYDAIAEHSRTIVWEVDAAGVFLYVGQISETVWGYAPEELVGKKHFYDLHPDEGRDEFQDAAIAALARREAFVGFETPVQTKDGRTVWMSASGMPVLGDYGQLVGYRGSSTDITDRKRAQEAIRLSEENYRSLFEHMLNGFTYCQMLYDEQDRPIDFITLEVNPAFERLTGLQGVVGKRISEVIPDVHDVARELFEIHGRVALTGRSERFDFFFKPIERWLSVSTYSPAKTFFVAILEDITDRKRDEEEREAMMALLKLLNSPTNTHELIHSVMGTLQEWSGCKAVSVRLQEGDDFPCFETRGFRTDFLTNEKYLCARDPNGRPACSTGGAPLLECYCGALMSGSIGEEHLTPGGTFWTNRLQAPDVIAVPRLRNHCFSEGFESFALVPLRSYGRNVGILHFADRRPDRFTPQAISRLERAAASLAIGLEQRRTQDALRASEERYRLISENTADVIWMWDLDSNRFTYASPSVLQVLGYTPQELSELGLLATLAPESCDRARAHLADIAAASQSGATTLTKTERLNLVRKDGTVIQTEVAATFIAEPERHGKILGVTRDITDRVQSEARFMQAQKLESMGRLAGGVAHDFNNLLTVINGYSGLVLAKLSPGDPIRENVAEIATAGERAAQLTKQLLMLSRKQIVQAKPVVLNEIIIEVESMLRRVIGEDIRIESTLSPDLGPVMADPGQLHQVLMNLAVNARDAMPTGGKLLLETSNIYVIDDCSVYPAELKPGPYVMLTVEDTGVGMSKQVMSHLFEPFFTTKQPGQGTGLGLATVYGVVTQLGGAVHVYSEPQHGTAFKIYLPRIDAIEMAAEAPKPEVLSVRGTETILLVEDQDQLRVWAGRVLRDCGYTVYDAANPADALTIAGQTAGPIHLLFTDVVMPGMSGPQLAARLTPLRPEMKVIFASGYSEREILEPEALAAAAAYLKKPFSAEMLAQQVREALSHQRLVGTIVVADDEPGARNLLKNILTSAGYRVLEARNGREAVEQIGAQRVDLLITDLAMPEQEGIETIQELHSAHPDVRIIATSGQFAGPLLRAAKRLGAHESLPKPLQQDQLLEAVARQIATAHESFELNRVDC